MENLLLGQIFTFYSYKGGTGRSMALANIACLLAQKMFYQQNILMIDWDLEAPGLHRFFQDRLSKKKVKSLEHQLGLIDLFYEMQNAFEQEDIDAEIDDKFFDKLEIEKYILETDVSSLFLMTAGRYDSSYSTRVNRFDWESFFNKSPWLISKFSNYLARKFRYVLIDSRTGYTDISSVCTALMPEKLVLVFTPNRQSISGVLDLIRTVTKYRRQSDDLRPLVMFPLVSRVENAEEELQKKWRFGDIEKGITGYQTEFEAVFKEVYGLHECDLMEYFNEVKIQHIPRYSFGEEIAVLSPNSEDRLSLAQSYENFLERLSELDSPWAGNEREHISDNINIFEDSVFKNDMALSEAHSYNRPGKKLRVFLAHSFSDKNVVRELYQRLISQDWIDPWLDEEKLLPGQDWNSEIEKAVKFVDAMIVCFSSKSVSKEGYVQKEIRFGLDIALEKKQGSLFIIPLRLDECQPPSALRQWQYVDYFPDERKQSAYRKIINSLEIRRSLLSHFDRLSQQEKNVLLLVSEGKTNREIAKALFLGEGTVRNYVSSILAKLGLNNRAEAAAYAVEHDLRTYLL